MTTTIQKWGNSLALRIPKNVARDVQLENGSVVNLAVRGGKVVVEEGRHFFQPFLGRNPGIPVYQHTQVMAPEKIPATRYYRRVMIPFGWRYSAHLLFWREEKVETSIALRRRRWMEAITSACWFVKTAPTACVHWTCSLIVSSTVG